MTHGRRPPESGAVALHVPAGTTSRDLLRQETIPLLVFAAAILALIWFSEGVAGLRIVAPGEVQTALLLLLAYALARLVHLAFDIRGERRRREAILAGMRTRRDALRTGPA